MRLWAIEGDDHVKEILSFAQADNRVMIKPDIDLHRELEAKFTEWHSYIELRCCFLPVCRTVKEAMDDKTMSSYINEPHA